MTGVHLLGMAAALSLLTTPAFAQQASGGTQDQLPDIIVTAPSGPDVIVDFARQAAAAPAGRRVARWDREICIEIRNLDLEHTTYLRERIGARARQVGLRMGSDNCASPVLIIGSDDGAATARAVVEGDPDAFQPRYPLNTNLGREALAQFTTADVPVRWWHVSAPVDADTGEPVAGRLINATRASRLKSEIRDDLKLAVIIIDVAGAGAAPFDALSDYVAMVALAPVDPRPDPVPWPTVMNLFQQGQVMPDVVGLSVLDRDYLQALYSSTRDHAVEGQQRAEIVQRMALLRERREKARDR